MREAGGDATYSSLLRLLSMRVSARSKKAHSRMDEVNMPLDGGGNMVAFTGRKYSAGFHVLVLVISSVQKSFHLMRGCMESQPALARCI